MLPFVLIIIALYNNHSLVPPYNPEKLGYGIYIVISVIISFEIARFMIFAVRRKSPFIRHARKHLLLEAAVIMGAAILVKLATYAIYGLLAPAPGFSIGLLIGFILEAILVTVLSICLYEALYFYARYLRSEKEKEQLQKAKLQSQLDILKTQVNPHFLFNSLNSLTGLISKDCVKAEEFVEEMSGVYRYLLRNNIGDLTTLKEELQFIRSYLHMQQTRFGKGLQYSIEVNDECLSWMLPPLTLQMLVENAIKHNVISVYSPLRIIISNNEEWLLIKNNLQKKYRRVSSGRVGLANIISKYKLLNAAGIEVEENEKEFIVSIPLIKHYEPENSYS
jgi:putative flippase GtrA